MKTTIATLLIAISLTACNNSSVVDSGLVNVLELVQDESVTANSSTC